MKRAVFTLWLLLAAVAATAQSEPTPPEFEYSDLQRLTPEDYIDMQLPPLHVLMENARHAPQVGYYESNREIEERELKTVRRNWMRNFKLNANYNYGSSDIYNQNYQDSNIPIWTTTTTGREQSWWNVGASLSILTALNTARLRQKNLQMTSATLKIINAPVLPLEAEPSKRKMMVAAAGLATLLFVLGFFILLELLDRTLRDKVRAERITKGRVIGAFPGKAYFGQRRFTKQYREIASRYIGNAAVNYFDPAKQPNVLNILSTERGDGKSLIAEHLAAFFREANMKVRIVSWNKDFDIERKEYLLAEKLGDFVHDTPGEVPLAEADVVLVEYPPFATSSVPKELLRHAALSIVIAPANRTWKDTDQLLFEKAEKLSGRTPVVLCLNCAGRDVVQTFTGLMPPYRRLRRLGYQISQFGFTAVK